MINIRKKIYFMLDYLRGSEIRHELEDIQRIFHTKSHTSELNNILDYARKTIPFYRTVETSDLTSFPVMSKACINSNIDTILSNQFSKESLHSTSTSGSTGEPFVCYQDKVKRNRTIADLMTMFSKYGFETGDRYVFIRSWVKHYGLSRIKQIKQNFIAVDVNTFDAKAKETLLLRLQKDKKIVALVTYGSALEDFIIFLQEKGISRLQTGLKVIFSSADIIKDQARIAGQEIFSCPIINRYSNEECGILAYTNAWETTLHLNIASYHFELLKQNSDAPCEPGELDRIVVTDLFNHAMPLIRYDTGDLGISNDFGADVKSLISLEGRVADCFYSSKGILITGVTLSTYMQEYSFVDKYQLTYHKDNTLTLKVVSNREDIHMIKDDLQDVLGDFQIERVDTINTQKNGKFKQIVKE